MTRLMAVVLVGSLLPGCGMLDAGDSHGTIPRRVSRRSPAVSGSRTHPASRPATPVAEGPLTLAKAIEVSLANNPQLAAARHDVDVASAEHDIAIGAIMPTVHVKSGYEHFLDRHRLGPPRYVGEHRVYSDGVFSSDVVLTMPLFTGGRLISEIKAAELLRAASEHRLARSQEELVFDVSSMFYSILAQDHVIESLKFSQQTLKEHLKRITELIEAQKAAKVDQLRTEVRIADLEQQLVKERNVLAIENRVLTNLLGVSKGNSGPVRVTGQLAIDEITTMDVEDGVARAFGQRGDYLAARSALEAQKRRLDSARAGHWPTLALQGAIGGRWAACRVDYPQEDDNKDSAYDDVGSVALVLDIPIFEGGRIVARIRREQAKLAVDRERLRKLELQIHLDVETSLLNVASSFERVKATEKSIEQAKESLRIEREKYDFGKGAITDVLDAQSALLDSQRNYYRALADCNTALAEFRLATGEIR